MSTVLFCGAGFSAPFGQPTMNNFLHYAYDKLGERDSSFIRELVLDARRANSMLESSPTNLEDMLSFAVMGDRLQLFDSKGEPRGPRLQRILQSIYSYLPDEGFEKYWGRYEVMKEFLGLKERRDFEGFTVITTNYDINLESAFRHCGAPCSLPFEYNEHVNKKLQLTGNIYASNKSKKGPPIYKLHGSVNWFENESAEPVEVVGAFGNTAFNTKVPYVCTRNFEHSGDPIIIPPTFLKPNIDGVLLQIWSGAAEAINKAETIVFIGYSFPPSDVEMRYFLARSLDDNASIRRIIIVDLYADDIVSRLKASESGFGSHFKSFLRPIPGNWIHLKRVLD